MSKDCPHCDGKGEVLVPKPYLSDPQAEDCELCERLGFVPNWVTGDELERVMELNKASRYTSDRAVNCLKCGEPLGYVVVNGHKEWEHVECPPYAQVRAVYPSIEKAYAAYDADPRVNGPEDFDAFKDALVGAAVQS